MKFYFNCGFGNKEAAADVEACERRPASPKKIGLKKAVFSSAFGYVGGIMLPLYALGVTFAALIMLRIYANVTWFGFLYLYTAYGLAVTASLLLSAAAVYLAVRSILTFKNELKRANTPVATLVCGIVGACLAAIGLFILFISSVTGLAFFINLLG